MNIAYIIPGCSVSGGIAVVCQHANRLMERGHNVFLLSTSEVKPMDWFPGQKVPVYPFEEWEGKLDIAVATGWSTAFSLPRISAKQKCYFVQSDETRFHPQGSRWQHLTALTYFFGVHYLTEAKWIQAWLKESFGHEAALIPNGLDEKIFAPAEPLESKSEKPRILLEGAIGLPYKGMKEAFSVVQDLDVEVWCVSSYGKPEKTWKCDRFFEHVPMAEMKHIYSSCDILLKLSRVEGFFGPPMEMMACGGVSVVGKVTGYDEYIEDGVNALVVEPFDIVGAKKAIESLIRDHQLRNKLIDAGTKTAKVWNWDDSIDKLEAFYKTLFSSKDAYSSRKRAVYDQSLTYMYEQVSNIVDWTPPVSAQPVNNSSEQIDDPQKVNLLPLAQKIPDHVQRLANILVRQKLFHYLADFLRWGYRLAKKFRS